MGATFFALGEALVDPVAIGLVFDDENPAIRRAADAAAGTHRPIGLGWIACCTDERRITVIRYAKNVKND